MLRLTQTITRKFVLLQGCPHPCAAHGIAWWGPQGFEATCHHPAMQGARLPGLTQAILRLGVLFQI